jgi:hypothetical protein
VADVEIYDVQDVPRDLVFGRSDMARLNLITCNGTWDQASKSYDKRVVVYAVLPTLSALSRKASPHTQKDIVASLLIFWCAVRDSNPWPSPRQGDALPTELTAHLRGLL